MSVFGWTSSDQPRIIFGGTSSLISLVISCTHTDTHTHTYTHMGVRVEMAHTHTHTYTHAGTWTSACVNSNSRLLPHPYSRSRCTSCADLSPRYFTFWNLPSAIPTTGFFHIHARSQDVLNLVVQILVVRTSAPRHYRLLDSLSEISPTQSSNPKGV